MASTPARPRSPSTPQPVPLAGSPAPTRHSRHQAQRSQHAKRSQGLHVEAAFPPRRPSLLRIDLLQGHGEKPEKAQKREGRGEKKEGQGGREGREDEGQGSVMESELCRQEGEGQGSASSWLSPAPECTQGWAQPALPMPRGPCHSYTPELGGPRGIKESDKKKWELLRLPGEVRARKRGPWDKTMN